MLGYTIPDIEAHPIHRPVEGAVSVKQNQALTPAQIADYTAKGIAVSSSQNLVFD